MSQEKPNFTQLDWEKILWEQTPYRGVFIYKAEEQQDPSDPNIPLFTIMALKMKPQSTIPLHRHNRKTGWVETITFPNGGWFETRFDQEGKKVKTKEPFTIIIQAGETFGIKNMDLFQPLYFFSRMEPGFTGYAEIEEIK